MKRVLLLVGVLLATSTDLNACNLKCKFNLDCYNCISGGRLENCFLECNVCGGSICTGFAPVAGMAGGEAESPTETLLTRFETKPLANAIDPAVAQVMDWFWRWHDEKSKAGMAAPLQMEGGVVIDRKPHDFHLEVRQHGLAQVYELQIEALGKATLIVNPSTGGRQELEYEFQRSGEERAKAGFVMLETP